MMKAEEVGSRSEFMVRVQRFADVMLARLDAVSAGRDVDEKEARLLGSLVLKALRIWDKALLAGTRDARLENELTRVKKKASEPKVGEVTV